MVCAIEGYLILAVHFKIHVSSPQVEAKTSHSIHIQLTDLPTPFPVQHVPVMWDSEVIDLSILKLSDRSDDVRSGCEKQVCLKRSFTMDSNIMIDAVEGSLERDNIHLKKQTGLSYSTSIPATPARKVQSPQAGYSSSSAQPKHNFNVGIREQGSANDKFWQRLNWGSVHSFVRKGPSANEQNGESRPNTAFTLEIAIMGSALILTAGLQIQEVVTSRGGYDPLKGNSIARDVFLLASTLSFTLSFYSIVTSSVLLVSLSSCSSR